MTREDIERELREYLRQLDPEGKWVMPDLVSSKAKTSSQNAYMWTLCQKLAEKLQTTKEEIYLEAVRKKGSFTFILVEENDADRFVSTWNEQGIGWYAERTDLSEAEGAVVVVCYPGTSTYTSEQMRNLIEYIVSECEEQNIDTDTQKYLAEKVLEGVL